MKKVKLKNRLGIGIVMGFLLIGLTGCGASTSNNPVNPTLNVDTGSSASNTKGSIQIEISNFAFVPNNITIKAGDTVTWKNSDSVGHTVDFTVGGTEIKSNVLNSGDTFSHKFNKPGAINYFCSIHRSMIGKITVN